MYFILNGKKICVFLSLIFLFTTLLYSYNSTASLESFYTSVESQDNKKFIKWVDFNCSYEAMAQALKYDITSYNEGGIKLNWIELLAYAAAKTGGSFKNKKNTDIDKLATRLKNGEHIEVITSGMKYYPFYLEAYTAVLGNFVGEYWVEIDDIENPGNKKLESHYGLKVFSPIAKNYGYSHYDDFGDSRSFGFSRPHKGNDLMAAVGTPIIAVEGGTIEEFGWNRYGGWRIGIRSFDTKRYYYYAHLRKNHPFHKSLSIGQTVSAGQVIGYLGMTGYSTKENVNNINKPHLHFGMQLIFDESQKDSPTQIWIDVYKIVKLLQKNCSAVERDSETKDYNAKYKVFPKQRSVETINNI